MLKWFAAIAPPIALLMVGVLLLEPPALTPRERVPTLRLLTSTVTGPVPETTRDVDIVLAPDPVPDPEPDATEGDLGLPSEFEQESPPELPPELSNDNDNDGDSDNDEESPSSAEVTR